MPTTDLQIRIVTIAGTLASIVGMVMLFLDVLTPAQVIGIFGISCALLYYRSFLRWRLRRQATTTTEAAT